jgi:hypothetical protein
MTAELTAFLADPKDVRRFLKWWRANQEGWSDPGVRDGIRKLLAIVDARDATLARVRALRDTLSESDEMLDADVVAMMLDEALAGHDPIFHRKT